MTVLAVLAAGVTFACSATGDGALPAGGGFEVFAPTGRTFEDYRVSGPEASYFNPAELEEVADELPGRLTIVWRRESNSPVTLTIADHDAASGTARFSIGTERNPASALFTRLSYGGICKAERAG